MATGRREQAPVGKTRFYDVGLGALFQNGEALAGYHVALIDVTRFLRLQTEVERSNHELETANEELQSAHEELETTNEELQSTNEELETTNVEMRERTGELDASNVFLHSILTDMRTGVVVVDAQGLVLTRNRRPEDLRGLRADEVRGRPFLDLDIGLPIAQLQAAMRSAERGAPTPEDVVLETTTRRGRRILSGVSCSPLRSAAGADGRGVLMVMHEIGPAGAIDPAALRPDRRRRPAGRNSRR